MTLRPSALLLLLALPAWCVTGKDAQPHFQTSDRCLACHNGLVTKSGRDVSIGFAWRPTLMANSARDPYWQASVRRETLDLPQLQAHIEDECSVCHMPIPRYQAKEAGEEGRIFAHLPFRADKKHGREAADGVTCSVCHQISARNLGTPESFNGGFLLEPVVAPNIRPEYGPFAIDPGQRRIMNTSSGGYQPVQNTGHIRKSEICATCHTLITTAYAPDGKPVGSLPEQMPYKEWLNSDYRTRQTCQDCHMPAVDEPAPITRVFGVPRDGVKRHVFVAANFFMERMLGRYRDDLEVEALPQELESAASETISFLQDKAARLSILNVATGASRLQADVLVENLGGHKLPTAFPSRRSWLHLTVRDHEGRVMFESGALRADGSIVGNDNDSDPHKFEPHYTGITSSEQVQIYEDILGDAHGGVTTGLLTAVRYLKDNRLLPHGFDKTSPDPDVAVVGNAATDPNFTGSGNRVHYSVPLSDATGPFQIDAELLYQPVGYRWANNLKPYSSSPEPRRFTAYFDSMTQATTTVLARASITR